MRTLAIIVGGLLLLFLGLSFALPSRWQVERHLRIEAPVATVRPFVNDLARWPDWLPWSPKDDASIKRTITGAGVGARMEWSGNDIGHGELTFTAVTEGGVQYKSSVGGGRATFDGWVKLVPDGATTVVTWGEGGEFGNPVLRWFGTSFEDANGGDYEKGLLNLQRLAIGEAKRPLPGTPGTDPAAMVPIDRIAAEEAAKAAGGADAGTR